jgi:alkanesulfonate monooxygenase SsuD/methylene tetrahydromethanopterin reductase-like flavin-dependent oxidoreductase (luciferase family)
MVHPYDDEQEGDLMRFGLDVPTTGEYAEPSLLAELAAAAEQAGWDGFFLWDVLFPASRPDGARVAATDPWVALAAVATRTTRLRIGTMVTPLARQRPWLVARTAVALDHLSHGRFVLGAGAGYSPCDFIPFGEDFDPRQRAARLDEALEVIAGLWSGEPYSYAGAQFRIEGVTLLPRPLQKPRIPIWLAGGWPRRAPFRRAARWDGALLKPLNSSTNEVLTPDEVRAVAALILEERTSDAPIDLLMSEETPGDPRQAADIVRPYAEAGATWWIEHPYGRPTLAAFRQRILSGPPAL